MLRKWLRIFTLYRKQINLFCLSIKEVNADILSHLLNCFTLCVVALPALVLQKGQVQHGDLPEGAAGLDMVTSSVLLKCRNLNVIEALVII